MRKLQMKGNSQAKCCKFGGFKEHIHHPEMAKRLEAETPKGKKLPSHVKSPSFHVAGGERIKDRMQRATRTFHRT